MARFLFITLILAFIYASGFSQYLSEQGRFQVAERSGCAPFTVNIATIAPNVCDGSNPCDADYNGDNAFVSFNAMHTYTQPGTYWLRILFQSIGVDSLQIEVLDDAPPAFDIYTCGGNQVVYNITDTYYDEYVVDFNDGSPPDVVPAGMANGMHSYALAGPQAITVRGRNAGAQDNCTATGQPFMSFAILPPPVITGLVVTDESQIQLNFNNRQYIQYKLEVATNDNTPFQFLEDVYNTSTLTVGNLDTDNNYYCFRLGAYDPCNNTTTYSNVICSADLNITAQNNVNRLDWSTHPGGITDYSLERDFSPYVSVPGNITTFNDIDIECKTTYSYQLISNYANGSRSYSLIKSGTAISNTPPAPVQNITAVVDGSSVALTWIQDPAFDAVQYTITKSVGGSDFTEAGVSDLPAFTDDAYAGDEPVCYRIAYVDRCDNTSQAVIDACPIQLVGEQQDDNSVSLSWNPYEGWALGAQTYVIEKYTDNGFLLATFDVGTNTSFTDNSDDPIHQIHIYVVKASANEGSLGQAISNTVTITRDPRLSYPNTFTPNGDGLNDRFEVYGQFVNSFRLSIFNRWGELIYTTDDISQGWDGTRDGKLMPEGSYAFRADLIDYLGRPFNVTGGVLLLRKK